MAWGRDSTQLGKVDHTIKMNVCNLLAIDLCCIIPAQSYNCPWSIKGPSRYMSRYQKNMCIQIGRNGVNLAGTCISKTDSEDVKWSGNRNRKS